MNTGVREHEGRIQRTKETSFKKVQNLITKNMSS